MIAVATAELRPRDVVITISTTPSFAAKWLVARLGNFSAEHPDIRVRLDASYGLANFQTDGVDVAIRQGKPPFGPGLVSDQLFPSTLIAVCRPDLANGSHPIHPPQDLSHHLLLQDGHGLWPLFLQKAFGADKIPEMKTMSFNQTSLAIDAAIARQGVALTNRAIVEADLAANRLCQPFDFSVAADEGYFIVTPRTPRHPGPVALMRDWLARQSTE